MDKQVYIVHGSAIVQKGLADILRKSFKCAISCHKSFSELLKSENISLSQAVIFIEDEIANSEEYLKFLDEPNQARSFSIVNCNKENIQPRRQYTLFLNHSSDEIYERVKHVFEQKEFIDDEKEGLTNREIDVLKLVALGYSNKQIADKLFISTHTVMSHRKNMTEKLGIKSISGLTVYAIINNYINTTKLDVKDLI